MLSNKIRIAIVALAGAAALALPGSALAQNPLEWSLTGGASEQPYTFNTYTLGDVHRPLSCRYGPFGCWQDLVNRHETYGVDLNWNNPAFDSVGNPLHEGNAQWQFVREGNPRWPAAYPSSCYQVSGNEQVALYNTTRHEYLIDSEQNRVGVHLGWSSTPQYQWKVSIGLLEQSTYSARVAQLYNTAEPGPNGAPPGAYLVMGHQTWGVDLRWLHAPYGLPYTYNPPAPCRLTASEEPPRAY